MGTSNSKSDKNKTNTTDHFESIRDEFSTFKQLTQHLEASGMESCNLLFFYDFTLSNRTTGKLSFGGKNMHDITGKNPYSVATEICCKTFENFDDDKQIPLYGYGDSNTGNEFVFPFIYKKTVDAAGKTIKEEELECNGFDAIVPLYKQIASKVKLLGPTTFAPAIEVATYIVKKTRKYHIAIIFTDGDINNEADQENTINAIIEASKVSLSIIIIGLGDGPFDLMNQLDKGSKKQDFDNVQFVHFNKVLAMDGVDVNNINYDDISELTKVHFSLHALMEIPKQYAIIKKLKKLGKKFEISKAEEDKMKSLIKFVDFGNNVTVVKSDAEDHKQAPPPAYAPLTNVSSVSKSDAEPMQKEGCSDNHYAAPPGGM